MYSVDLAADNNNKELAAINTFLRKNSKLIKYAYDNKQS